MFSILQLMRRIFTTSLLNNQLGITRLLGSAFVIFGPRIPLNHLSCTFTWICGSESSACVNYLLLEWLIHLLVCKGKIRSSSLARNEHSFMCKSIWSHASNSMREKIDWCMHAFITGPAHDLKWPWEREECVALMHLDQADDQTLVWLWIIIIDSFTGPSLI